LTYVGLISIADDDGRLKGNPMLLKSKIYPMDEGMSSSTMEKDLVEIEKVGLIIRYSVNGSAYIQHPNWSIYQKIRNDLYAPSKLPPPDGCNEDVTEPLRKRDDTVTVTKLNLTKHNIDNDQFEQLWKTYPGKAEQKGSKKKAREKLQAKTYPYTFDETMAAFQNYGQYAENVKNGYIKQVTTFLNGDFVDIWKDFNPNMEEDEHSTALMECPECKNQGNSKIWEVPRTIEEPKCKIHPEILLEKV